MKTHEHFSLHSKLYDLMQTVSRKLQEADTPGRQMSKREQSDLTYILSVMENMLAEDLAERSHDPEEIPCRNSSQYLNTQCEFFDLDANRIQCAIGCDMYHCSKRCIYATNVPGTLPPYCTKYMKGRL